MDALIARTEFAPQPKRPQRLRISPYEVSSVLQAQRRIGTQRIAIHRRDILRDVR